MSFRHKTLIFDFVASPFIHRYVIKHHVEKYSGNICRDMLLSNFYVDNLVKNHASSDLCWICINRLSRLCVRVNFFSGHALPTVEFKLNVCRKMAVLLFIVLPMKWCWDICTTWLRMICMLQ